MKRYHDLDIFLLYTGVHYSGSRSRILKRALADRRTRDLVWLYIAVNEIPWKRFRPPKRFADRYRDQGEKAARLGALWRTSTRYWLERPFRVWYADHARPTDGRVGRSEEQRWRESIWLRRRQSTSSSAQLKRQHTSRSR